MQQNAAKKCKNKTLQEKTHTLLNDSGVASYFWVKAAFTTS